MRLTLPVAVSMGVDCSGYEKFAYICRNFNGAGADWRPGAIYLNMPKQKEHRVEIRNKRASFDYEFLETYEAGIVLVGTEIKSIRAGKASLADSFCYFVGNELFVKGMNVSTYFWGSWGQHEPMRDRKLLLTKRELRHLRQAVKEKGLTIIATKLYINEKGIAKLVIALAKGKKVYDKRQSIKEKDIRREMERGE
jgi:SsrA-binding protein